MSLVTMIAVTNINVVSKPNHLLANYLHTGVAKNVAKSSDIHGVQMELSLVYQRL